MSHSELSLNQDFQHLKRIEQELQELINDNYSCMTPSLEQKKIELECAILFQKTRIGEKIIKIETGLPALMKKKSIDSAVKTSTKQTPK